MSLSNEQVLAFIKKNPVGVLSGVLCLAFGAGIYFRGDLTAAAQQDLDEKTRLEDRYSTNIKYADQLTENVEALTEDNKAIENRLISVKAGAGNDAYFFGIERAAVGSKIISLNSSQPPTGKTGLVPMSYNIGVQGTYPQVLDFLRRLENGLYICRINTATLSAGGGGGEGGAGGAGANLITMRLNVELLGRL